MDRNRIANDLILLASELLPRIRATFQKSDKLDDRTMNSIQGDIQRFVTTLRGNEELECFVSRRDTSEVMEITVGFTDHEAMQGIVSSMKSMIEKIGKRFDAKVVVEVFDKK
jgi:hypothetical protein